MAVCTNFEIRGKLESNKTPCEHHILAWTPCNFPNKMIFTLITLQVCCQSDQVKQKLAAWNWHFVKCIRALCPGILANWPHHFALWFVYTCGADFLYEDGARVGKTTGRLERNWWSSCAHCSATDWGGKPLLQRVGPVYGWKISMLPWMRVITAVDLQLMYL